MHSPDQVVVRCLFYSKLFETNSGQAFPTPQTSALHISVTGKYEHVLNFIRATDCTGTSSFLGLMLCTVANVLVLFHTARDGYLFDRQSILNRSQSGSDSE